MPIGIVWKQEHESAADGLDGYDAWTLWEKCDTNAHPLAFDDTTSKHSHDRACGQWSGDYCTQDNGEPTLGSSLPLQLHRQIVNSAVGNSPLVAYTEHAAQQVPVFPRSMETRTAQINPYTGRREKR